MNVKRYNLGLLCANAVTIVLLLAVHFLPEKRLVLTSNASRSASLSIEHLPDGSLSSEWLNAAHTSWQCNQPEDFKSTYLPCAWRIELSSSVTQGIDLTRYDNMTIKMSYSGNANKIRIGIRNYNPTYSKPQDINSAKFNQIQLHARELNKEVRINLSAFAAADWWLNQYNVPLSESSAEVNNAVAVTIDIGELGKPGTHQFSIETLEFRGKLVRVVDWYLAIISIWLCGIFVFALKNILRLNAKTQQDRQVINQLSTNNKELKTETSKLRRLSTIDGLTQLYNRFGIDQIIAQLSAQDILGGPKYSLILADVDHFKRINDQHGHHIGDKVLQHVAQLFQAHLRAGDYVGRWGGEEFLIIMPGANKKTAMAMAEMIREALLNSECDSTPPVKVSASFGVSERLSGEEFADSFKRADNALYQAKASGRNCCVCAEDVSAL